MTNENQVTVRELILMLPRGQAMLDKYLLGGYVLALPVDPDAADTCVIGDSHMNTSHHVCLKKVGLEEQIDMQEDSVLTITKGTWKKSIEQNFLKAKLDEWKSMSPTERDEERKRIQESRTKATGGR